MRAAVPACAAPARRRKASRRRAAHPFARRSCAAGASVRLRGPAAPRSTLRTKERSAGRRVSLNDVDGSGAACPYDRWAEGRFCSDHVLVRCTKLLKNAPQEEEASQSSSSHSSSDEEEVNEEDRCGFLCCPSCLHDHRCGDDPHDYL